MHSQQGDQDGFGAIMTAYTNYIVNLLIFTKYSKMQAALRILVCQAAAWSKQPALKLKQQHGFKLVLFSQRCFYFYI